jgi:hypothetical protein
MAIKAELNFDAPTINSLPKNCAGEVVAGVPVVCGGLKSERLAGAYGKSIQNNLCNQNGS